MAQQLKASAVSEEEALHLAWTVVELILLAEVWVSQPGCCEHGRAVPCYSSVLWQNGQGRGYIPTHQREAGGRAGPDVLRAEELSLSIICNTPESGPYTSTGQHSRVGPEGVGVGETPLRM